MVFFLRFLWFIIARTGRKENPTSIEVDVYMVLSCTFMLTSIGSMDSEDIANLANDRAVFEAFSIYYD